MACEMAAKLFHPNSGPADRNFSPRMAKGYLKLIPRDLSSDAEGPKGTRHASLGQNLVPIETWSLQKRARQQHNARQGARANPEGVATEPPRRPRGAQIDPFTGRKMRNSP